MDGDIEKIVKNSTKAELLEKLSEKLEEFDKAVVVLVQDHDNGGFASKTLLLGCWTLYEVTGMLEVAKHDLQEDYYRGEEDEA